MQSLVDGYVLHICNDPALLDDADAWTYEHSLPGRHHTDFVSASYAFLLRDSKAIHDLDMGSDHRALSAKMHLRGNAFLQIDGG